jgi:hypothetical protein
MPTTSQVDDVGSFARKRWPQQPKVPLRALQPLAIVQTATMGNLFSNLLDRLFGSRELRVVMLGLDAAGKTTILYKLHIGEVLTTVSECGVPELGLGPL